MQKIKSFIYLDEYKIYSISSQIFEGITESLTNFQGATTEKEEKQKGEFGSGRIMADILKSESSTQEKKYLHDYSYTLFEEHLRKSGKILSLSTDNIDEKIEGIDNTGFVEMRGKVIFNDMNILKSTTAGFNELGEALTYITNFSQMEEARQQLEKVAENTKDRNQKAKIRQKLKNGIDVKKMAKDQGLNMDSKFLEKIAFAVDHENNTEVPRQPQYMREVIMNMVEALFAMESSFSGKLANEIIVDPIAIYREI